MQNIKCLLFVLNSMVQIGGGGPLSSQLSVPNPFGAPFGGRNVVLSLAPDIVAALILEMFHNHPAAPVNLHTASWEERR